MDQWIILHRLKQAPHEQNVNFRQHSLMDSTGHCTGVFKPENNFSMHVWSTCLRELIFIQSSELDTFKSKKVRFNQYEYDVLREEKALQFLIEVLCGLHSPILGETEVFGQFKLFIEQQAPHFEQQRWLQFVYTVVKSMRKDYVSKLGSNSYGSLVRKDLKEIDKVIIVGSGHLALEICPWLNHLQQVTVLTRSVDKSEKAFQKFSNVKLQNLSKLTSQLALTQQALIIAAPISEESLRQFLFTDAWTPRIIIDLRTESSLEIAELQKYWQQRGVEFLHLNHYFSDLSEHRYQLQQQLSDITNTIQQNIKNYLNRVELRPLGWDDLCA